MRVGRASQLIKNIESRISAGAKHAAAHLHLVSRSDIYYVSVTQSYPKLPRAPQGCPELPRAAQSSPELPKAAQSPPEPPRGHSASHSRSPNMGPRASKVTQEHAAAHLHQHGNMQPRICPNTKHAAAHLPKGLCAHPVHVNIIPESH